MKCSDEKLQSLAQDLLSMELFTKEGRGTGWPPGRQPRPSTDPVKNKDKLPDRTMDPMHNPPYVFTITFEDGTRLVRRVGHDQAYRTKTHPEIAAWLESLKDELRESHKESRGGKGD